ncbi:MAG: hypothetical protein JWN48_2724 [Myxococcaceae bacterium]|nr:hypothetical protein [Myxococcaceae bacterium]
MWPCALLSETEALLWTARLAALSVALQAAELLQVRAAFAEQGTFPWRVLRRDFAGASPVVRAVLDGLLSYRPFVALLWLQLAGALALPWLDGALVPGLVLLSVLAVGVRFRGTYNGGSDSMTIVVLLALWLARLGASFGSTRGTQRACLGYIAAQLALSYLVAGVAKLRHDSWRDGRALMQLVRVRQYSVPAWLTDALSRPALARLAAWSVVGFELSFPLALALAGTASQLLLALGLGFHLAIAVGLGLNRFFWAWLAAYPALLYWSQRL